MFPFFFCKMHCLFLFPFSFFSILSVIVLITSIFPKFFEYLFEIITNLNNVQNRFFFKSFMKFMHLFNKELICLIFLGVQAATLFFTSLPLSHQTQYQHHYCRPIILFSSFYPISLSSLWFKAPCSSVICLSDLLPPYPSLLCHLHHHQHISCRF